MKLSKVTKAILEDQGYNSLEEYLENLSEDYDVDLVTVYMMADLLGETELFDGLVSSLEDM